MIRTPMKIDSSAYETWKQFRSSELFASDYKISTTAYECSHMASGCDWFVCWVAEWATPFTCLEESRRLLSVAEGNPFGICWTLAFVAVRLDISASRNNACLCSNIELHQASSCCCLKDASEVHLSVLLGISFKGVLFRECRIGLCLLMDTDYPIRIHNNP